MGCLGDSCLHKHLSRPFRLLHGRCLFEKRLNWLRSSESCLSHCCFFNCASVLSRLPHLDLSARYPGWEQWDWQESARSSSSKGSARKGKAGSVKNDSVDQSSKERPGEAASPGDLKASDDPSLKSSDMSRTEAACGAEASQKAVKNPASVNMNLDGESQDEELNEEIEEKKRSRMRSGPKIMIRMPMARATWMRLRKAKTRKMRRSRACICFL